jgi:hypothetical protein
VPAVLSKFPERKTEQHRDLSIINKWGYMKPKAKDENRLGPVNPFNVGSAFIEAAKKLEWIVEDKTERHRQYFITPNGFEEMTKLGMNIERALLYRQPPAEQPRRAHARTHHRTGGRRRR